MRASEYLIETHPDTLKHLRNAGLLQLVIDLMEGFVRENEDEYKHIRQ